MFTSLGSSPFAAVVLAQNGHHALDRAEDGAVDHHRGLLAFLAATPNHNYTCK